ncbi:TPA: hypothetical protein ACNV0S_003731, partial [Proteus mirabilis]
HNNSNQRNNHHNILSHQWISQTTFRSNHPTRLTKGYNHYSVQGCKQEIDTWLINLIAPNVAQL